MIPSRSTSASWFVAVVTTLTVIAASNIAMVGDSNSLVLSAAVAVFGGALAYLSASRWRGVLTQIREAARNELASIKRLHAADHIPGLEKLCEGVLPIWLGQVEVSRLHTENSVTALANRFSEISRRIGRTMPAAPIYLYSGLSIKLGWRRS